MVLHALSPLRVSAPQGTTRLGLRWILAPTLVVRGIVSRENFRACNTSQASRIQCTNKAGYSKCTGAVGAFNPRRGAHLTAHLAGRVTAGSSAWGSRRDRYTRAEEERRSEAARAILGGRAGQKAAGGPPGRTCDRRE